MPLSKTSIFACVMLLSASASAQDVNACISASEKGLALRKSGKLVDARKELAACAAEACPDAIKVECKKRIGEVNAMMPGVVFDVKDASGNSVTQVKVSIDGAPLVDHLDGMAVPVDPGPHKFTFEVAGQPPVERTFLIAEGDKAHRETIALGAGGTSASASAGTGTGATNGGAGGGAGAPNGALGGEGESCRATSDCTQPLRCIKRRCQEIKTKDTSEKPQNDTPPGESSHGGIYVQAVVAGVAWTYFPDFVARLPYNWAGFRPDIEFGFHPSGRHDGFVIGVRQAFVLTMAQGLAGGVSTLRLGWDIPIQVGERELVIGPFVSAGVGYVFDGPSAGVHVNGGADGKLFIASGFYAFGRLEAGVQCFHDGGICAFDLVAGAGAGFAFGGKN